MSGAAAEAELPRDGAWVGGGPAPAALTLTRYADSDDLLVAERCYGHGYYLVQAEQSGVPGADLVRLLRRRTPAAIVVLASDLAATLVPALQAGADMVLPSGLPAQALATALQAVGRRGAVAPAAGWRLSHRRMALVQPGGDAIALSEGEFAVMRRFHEARGEVVARAQLMQALWQRVDPSMDNALQASVYRLRRRIEQSGVAMAPIQSVARSGYRFCGELAWDDAEPPPPWPVAVRHHVQSSGQGAPTLLWAHGYGCDQTVWRDIVPHCRGRSVLYDLAGYGSSPVAAYDAAGRHATLHGHALDLLEVCASLGGERPVFIGHSVSAMIGVLAARLNPQALRALVLVAPSPSYIDDGDYHGGYARADIERLLSELDHDYAGWSRAIAPVVMGQPERPLLAEGLAQRFCRADPAVARHFGRVTFLSDCRAALPAVQVPTLVLQCRDDALAPDAVGAYVARAVPGAQLVRLNARGHCPHVSDPEETAAALQAFVAALPD